MVLLILAVVFVVVVMVCWDTCVEDERWCAVTTGDVPNSLKWVWLSTLGMHLRFMLVQSSKYLLSQTVWPTVNCVFPLCNPRTGQPLVLSGNSCTEFVGGFDGIVGPFHMENLCTVWTLCIVMETLCIVWTWCIAVEKLGSAQTRGTVMDTVGVVWTLCTLMETPGIVWRLCLVMETLGIVSRLCIVMETLGIAWICLPAE